MTENRRAATAPGMLLPLGLICLFALCSLALALLGGGAYKRVQNAVDQGFSTTVTAGYLRTKLAHSNAKGAVTLREEDGVQVLVLAAAVDGVQYENRIFFYGGRLMEHFAAADEPFSTADGALIVEVADCRFSLDAHSGLFTAQITDPSGAGVRMAFALL